MKKPNLFIVGAARSGTTLLWNYLKSHPEVYTPENLMDKEPAHFSEQKRSRFGRLDVYERLFKEANDDHKWVGEASTAYLTDPKSARRIARYSPEARIIIILRSPIIRAHSLYRWMVQKGYEYAASFESALRLEHYRSQIDIPNYYEPEYFHNYLYFGSGLYWEQVKRYQDLFHDRVLILRLEDVVSDPRRELKKLCGFLEILYKVEPMPPLNQSVGVNSAAGQFILRKLTRTLMSELSFREESKQSPYNDYLSWLSGQALFHIEALKAVFAVTKSEQKWIMNLVTQIADELYRKKLEVNKSSIEHRDKLLEFGCGTDLESSMPSEDTVCFLKERYRNDVSRLSELTGLDFSDWLR